MLSIEQWDFFLNFLDAGQINIFFLLKQKEFFFFGNLEENSYISPAQLNHEESLS